jgi:cytochrome c553
MKIFADSLMVLALLVFSSFVFAGGDSAAGKDKAEICASCHGAEGRTNADLLPKLAGQKANYLVKQLIQYRDGTRKDAMMNALSEPLTDQDILDLAAYYSELDRFGTR